MVGSSEYPTAFEGKLPSNELLDESHKMIGKTGKFPYLNIIIARNNAEHFQGDPGDNPLPDYHKEIIEKNAYDAQTYNLVYSQNFWLMILIILCVYHYVRNAM